MKLSRMAYLGALLVLPFSGIAQKDAGIDLWDSWRQGFETYEAAEKQFKKRDLDEALKLYRESQQIFLKIRKASPEWNKEVVTYRLSLCHRKINAIEKPRKEAAEAARRQSDMDKLKAEIDTLNKQLRQTRVELIDAKSAAERNALTEKQVKKMMEENTELTKKIAARDASIASLKSDLEKADKSANYKKQLLKVKTDLEKSNQEVSHLRKTLEEQQARVKKYYDQRLASEGKVSQLEEKLRDFDTQKKKTEALAVENKAMAESLASTAEKLKQSEEKLISANKKNEELNEKISALESGKTVLPSFQKLQKDLADEKRKNEHLETISAKQALDLKTSNAALEKKTVEMNKVVMDLVRSAEVLTKMRSDYSLLAKNNEENKKVAETAKVLAVENALLKKNLEEIAKKYEDINSGKTTADAASAAEIARLQKTVAALNERCKQAENALETVKKNSTEIKVDTAEISKLQKELAETRNRCKQAETALETVKANSKSSAEKDAALLNTMKAEADTLKKSYAQLTEKYEVLKKSYDELSKKDIQKITENMSDDQKDSEKLQALLLQLETVSKERSDLQLKVTQLEKNAKDHSDLKLKVAQLEQIAKENAELQKKAAQVETFVKDRSDLLAKISELEQIQQEYLNLKKQTVAVAPSADLQNELDELKKVNRSLENALTVAKNDAKAKLSIYEADTVSMKNSLEVLKKQLISSQEEFEKEKKAHSLLKMEYADLEKKLVASVSSEDLKTAETEKEQLKSDLGKLKVAYAEVEAALKSSEDLVRIQKKRLEAYAKEIDPTAKDQIVKLTAAVTELQEGKIQYETTIRDFKGKMEVLTEDNKALKLANSALQSSVAELKVKPEEYLRKANDLLQKNIKLQETVEENKKQLETLTLGKQLDQSEIARLNKELQTARTLADRYRRELTEWDDIPQSDTSADLKKKDEAITSLVQENKDLREERDNLNTELSLAKDHAVKYKRLSKDIESNLRMTRDVLAKLKTVLARYTSGAEVEKLIAAEFKKEKSVVPAEIPAVKKPEPPREEVEKSQKDRALAEQQYKTVLEEGKTAESEERYSDALVSYWRANDILPEDPEAKMGLARVYFIRKDFDNAVKNYKTAVEKLSMNRNPEFEEKLQNLQKELLIEKTMKSAAVYLQNKKGAEAEKAYQEALLAGMKQDPDFEQKLEAVLGRKPDLEETLETIKKTQNKK